VRAYHHVYSGVCEDWEVRVCYEAKDDDNGDEQEMEDWNGNERDCRFDLKRQLAQLHLESACDR